MHRFSGDLQNETLCQLKMNLEFSKLHVYRVISLDNAKSSPFLSEFKTRQTTHKCWPLFFAWKGKFPSFFLTGSLLRDIIKRWRHIYPCVLRHSNIIAKLGNVYFALYKYFQRDMRVVSRRFDPPAYTITKFNFNIHNFMKVPLYRYSIHDFVVTPTDRQR